MIHDTWLGLISNLVHLMVYTIHGPQLQPIGQFAYELGAVLINLKYSWHWQIVSPLIPPTVWLWWAAGTVVHVWNNFSYFVHVGAILCICLKPSNVNNVTVFRPSASHTISKLSSHRLLVLPVRAHLQQHWKTFHFRQPSWQNKSNQAKAMELLQHWWSDRSGAISIGTSLTSTRVRLLAMLSTSGIRKNNQTPTPFWRWLRKIWFRLHHRKHLLKNYFRFAKCWL